jgi:hypothetical protein
MEEWKVYPDNPSFLVSNMGNVKFVHEHIELNVLPKRVGKYSRIQYKKLYINLHMLVAQLFLSNTLEHNNVRHKNGNTYDNRAENLEWYTIQHKGGINGGRHKKSSSKSEQTTDDDYIIQSINNTNKYAVFYKQNDDITFVDIYDSYKEAAESIQ